MAITRWAPFSAFTSLEREMQDMMSRFHTRPFLEGFEWRPTTDVYEEEGKLIVRSEIPGMDLEDIEIKVEDNVLHISGEKKLEKEVSEDDRYVRECRFGTFRRDVMLPEGVDVDRIHADYDNGVLMVRVPLPTEVAKPRPVRIPVEVPETVETGA
jgi:HSP20 family protein